MIKISIPSPPLALAASIFFCAIAMLSPSLIAEAKEPSLEGHSPVSYFTVNKPEKGSIEFSVQNNNGNTYYLTSAEQVEIFNQNPDKYRPRYHYCAYSVALGRRAPIDPLNFKVVGDTLLLFHKNVFTDGREQWDRSDKPEQELIKQADKQYTLLKF